ncbi:NmrA family NAD(P)-binding protein [Mycobacterium sp. URHB0044]|uniref:NmrA family NAD(P)-binding protein n=1 Tax=Mycobacterium sp. URHB0044 TaxID=1380386 RepID=UPI0006877963|nr:NmrA family NAD(P)-binding protein [Mycobacterium sp. URHB0044]
MTDVLVMGATGTTGSRVAALLAGRGVTTRLATRTPKSTGQIRFDWSDRDTYEDALRGVSAVYLIAPIGVADPVPLAEPFLEEAVRQRVRRVVQLSSSAVPEGSPGLGAMHRLVRTAMPEWAVLRPSWFMQNFSGDHLVARGVRDGEIVTATGDGRVAFIDAGDIAAVAARALTDEVPHNTEHILTGPEALSYADAADILTRHTGRTVRHRSVPADEAARRITEHGIPADFAQVLAAMDVDIRDGAEDRVTNTVETVTGRPARSFSTFAAEEFESGRPLYRADSDHGEFRAPGRGALSGPGG